MPVMIIKYDYVYTIGGTDAHPWFKDTVKYSYKAGSSMADVNDERSDLILNKIDLHFYTWKIALDAALSGEKPNERIVFRTLILLFGCMCHFIDITGAVVRFAQYRQILNELCAKLSQCEHILEHTYADFQRLTELLKANIMATKLRKTVDRYVAYKLRCETAKLGKQSNVFFEAYAAPHYMIVTSNISLDNDRAIKRKLDLHVINLMQYYRNYKNKMRISPDISIKNTLTMTTDDKCLLQTDLYLVK